MLFLGFTDAQSRHQPIPAEIAREAYEIYSALYRGHPPCDALDQGELIAIDPDTLDTPSGFLDDIRPRTPEERQMVDGLVISGKRHYLWEARFDFGRQYRILTDDDEAVLSDCKFSGFAGHPDRPECAAFAKVRFVRSFSLPSFNTDHTRALVRTARGCGPLCGGAEFTALWKTAKGWEVEKSDWYRACVLF